MIINCRKILHKKIDKFDNKIKTLWTIVKSIKIILKVPMKLRFKDIPMY